MPQLSLYLTDEQLSIVENGARAQKTSISKWVVSQIMARVKPCYPDGWAELFGSVGEDLLGRPEQPAIERREKL